MKQVLPTWVIQKVKGWLGQLARKQQEEERKEEVIVVCPPISRRGKLPAGCVDYGKDSGMKLS